MDGAGARRSPTRALERRACTGCASARGQGAHRAPSTGAARPTRRPPRLAVRDLAAARRGGGLRRPLGPQGARGAPAGRAAQGPRRDAAAARDRRRRTRSTPATTAPTSTPSARCATLVDAGAAASGALRRRALGRDAGGARGARPTSSSTARRACAGCSRRSRRASRPCGSSTCSRPRSCSAPAAATTLAVVTVVAASRELRRHARDRRGRLVGRRGGRRARIVGRRAQASPPIARLLADAKAATMMPEHRPGAVAAQPPVAAAAVDGRGRRASASSPRRSRAIAAGFAIIWALAWRRQDSAVVGDRGARRRDLLRRAARRRVRPMRARAHAGLPPRGAVAQRRRAAAAGVAALRTRAPRRSRPARARSPAPAGSSRRLHVLDRRAA